MRFNPLQALAGLAVRLGLHPVRVSGREHVPRRGAAVLVANHVSYLDPLFVAAVTRRPVRFLATAEAYRPWLTRLLLRGLGALELKRFRSDAVAVRRVHRCLAAGDIVGMFPEGERSPLGILQDPLPAAACLLARVDCPVIPVGVRGAYDGGARWSRQLRRRPIDVRVGPPLRFGDGDAGTTVRDALANLVGEAAPPVVLDGLDSERLRDVVWACPACRSEPAWHPATLSCDQCGAAWEPTPEGLFTPADGPPVPLAEVAAPLWAAPEPGPLRVNACAFEDPDFHGYPRPLRPLGSGTLEVGPAGLRFGTLEVPAADILRVTTERADTLQVATDAAMWQLKPDRASVFRLHQALRHWLGWAR